ncbi:MAG: FliG C-terminal domain-containing protein [Pseudomonadota bacterium]
MDSGIELTGMEKAAALLLIMGRDSAVKLSRFFTPEEISLLTQTASRFQTLDVETVEKLVTEFNKNYLSLGLFAEAEKLSDIFEDSTETESQQDVSAVNAGTDDTLNTDLMPTVEEISAFIENEPRHIGAFFLGTLDDDISAEVLLAVEASTRQELFNKLLERNPVEPKISKLMRNELILAIKKKNESDGSKERIESAAGLINFLPEDAGEELISFVNSQNPDAATILKKSIFKFSSIVELTKEARAILFDSVDTDEIVSSLADADEALKECVLEVLSQRNRRVVEAELSRATPDEEVVQAAKRKISGLVLKLSREGKIELQSSDDE